MGEGPILRISGLHKRYWGVQALKGVDMEVERGMIVGLLGPNGSGKSSLLKIVAGLVRPTRGSVLVDGRPPSRDTKRVVSFLPEGDHVYPWMTVRQALEFVAGFFPDWRRERAEELIDFLGLESRVTVGALSRGMRARLKLVLGMARDVPLVLLDEPLSGIDPPSRARIIKGIITAFRVGEQSILVSTHEVAECEAAFDRVVFLHGGQVRLAGEAESLRRQYGRSIRDIMEEVCA